MVRVPKCQLACSSCHLRMQRIASLTLKWKVRPSLRP